MSGYGMEEDIRKSLDAGFAKHLVKPVNIAALEDAIQGLSSPSTDISTRWTATGTCSRNTDPFPTSLFHRNIAAEQLRQLAGDGEIQAGGAMILRHGRVASGHKV